MHQEETGMSRATELYLEVKDSCVAIVEPLSRGDHSVQELGIQSEGGGGRKKPTVTWKERLRLGDDGRRRAEARGESEGDQRGRAVRVPAVICPIWGLTQSPLTHVCPAHVLTDELGLSTELLGVTGDSRPQPGKEGSSDQEVRGLGAPCPHYATLMNTSNPQEACKACV